MALFVAVALLTVGVSGLVTNAPAGGLSAATCASNPSYALPTPLDLTSAPTGLTVTDDGDSYYDVSGTDRDTIAAGLNECAPRFDGIKTDATYLAYTSYNLTWQYGIVADTSGMCRLSDVKVGLHLSQIYPRLMTTDISAPLATKWNAFITGTEEHEDGHLQIDKDLAGSLTDELQRLSLPCGSIGTAASSLTAKYSDSYKSENHEHDTDTDYGRTQGATW